MLQHSKLNAFSRSQSFHDCRIFVLNVFVDHSFYSFNLVKSVVQADDLSNKLRSFRNKTLVHLFVDLIEPISE